MTEMIVQAVMALAFVLLLIFAAFFAYRKRQKMGTNLISLVAYQAVGQKVGVAAVRVSDEILVLGVTPSEIKLLRQLPDTAELRQEAPGIAERVNKLRRMKEGI